jgi:hypothetical protein
MLTAARQPLQPHWGMRSDRRLGYNSFERAILLLTLGSALAYATRNHHRTIVEDGWHAVRSGTETDTSLALLCSLACGRRSPSQHGVQ